LKEREDAGGEKYSPDWFRHYFCAKEFWLELDETLSKNIMLIIGIIANMVRKYMSKHRKSAYIPTL
jgi:hypothetical protein